MNCENTNTVHGFHRMSRMVDSATKKIDKKYRHKREIFKMVREKGEWRNQHKNKNKSCCIIKQTKIVKAHYKNVRSKTKNKNTRQRRIQIRRKDGGKQQNREEELKSWAYRSKEVTPNSRMRDNQELKYCLIDANFYILF